jgi:hypothetical protein
MNGLIRKSWDLKYIFVALGVHFVSFATLQTFFAKRSLDCIQWQTRFTILESKHTDNHASDLLIFSYRYLCCKSN